MEREREREIERDTGILKQRGKEGERRGRGGKWIGRSGGEGEREKWTEWRGKEKRSKK